MKWVSERTFRNIMILLAMSLWCGPVMEFVTMGC